MTRRTRSMPALDFRMVRLIIGVAVMAAVFAIPVAAVQAQITPEALQDSHIRSAIHAIVEELYSRQHNEHFWEPLPYDGNVVASQSGGFTALTVLALLYAGESYQNPRLRDAVAYLESTNMGGTYAVSVRANVWAMLPPRFIPSLERDRTWLIRGFSERAGGWNYRQEPNTPRRDNSITQYGALGLWEAAKRGVTVDQRLWGMMENRFLDMQTADGGWNYQGDGPPTGSMTTAGLTVLFITQDLLHAREALSLDRRGQTRLEAAIELGMQWMSENFAPDENPGRAQDYYYYLYGVERVGLASGLKYFGEHDWFREGAAELIDRLLEHDPATGAMTVRRAERGRRSEIRSVDLSFALMFLSRGRVPVGINKLVVDGASTNNRPRDAANLISHVRSLTEFDMSWQQVPMAADPEEWLDAPLLLLASHEALPFVPDEAAAPLTPELTKLKRYLDLGGMVFAVNEGRGQSFPASIERAGRLMYPHLSWRDLPADHPAYTMYQSVRGTRPPLRALSNGVRELIILSPAFDLSEGLQAQTQRTETARALGSNIVLYASENLAIRPRLATHQTTRSQDRRHRTPVTILRARHGGAWNAEPLAAEVFATWAWNERLLDVSVREVDLDEISGEPTAATIVWVSGLGDAAFSPDELRSIDSYLRQGGTVLFESAGGGNFAQAAYEQLRPRFPQNLRPLLRHPVATAGADMPGGRAVSRVEYRPYAFEVFGARETALRLRGLEVNDTMRAFFSMEDISHALLDQPVWGVSGYSSESARQILANLLMYTREKP